MNFSQLNQPDFSIIILTTRSNMFYKAKLILKSIKSECSTVNSLVIFPVSPILKLLQRLIFQHAVINPYLL